MAALRAKGADVDVSIRPRKEWARLYAEKQLTKHSSAFAEKTRQFVRICG